MPPKPLLLAFDTAAAHCAAALMSGERVLWQQVDEMAKGQGEHLMPMLNDGLAGAGVSWQELSGLGVGVGPGNFTGIRISVAAARGLAVGLGIQAAGVTGFEALVWGHTGDTLCLISAPQDQVFAQRTGNSPSGPELIATKAVLSENWSGAETAIRAVSSYVSGIEDIDGRIARSPVSAVSIAKVAMQRLGADLPRPAPLYLRPADAAPSSDPPPVILR